MRSFRPPLPTRRPMRPSRALATAAVVSLLGATTVPAAVATEDAAPSSAEQLVQAERDGGQAPLIQASAVADPHAYVVVISEHGLDPDAVAEQLATRVTETAARLRATGVEVTEELTNVGAISVRATDAQVEAIRADQAVAFVEEDGLVAAGTEISSTGLGGTALTDPEASASATQLRNPALSWGLDRIDQASLPLDGTFTTYLDGTGVTAYIIDSGIRTDHQQWAGRLKPGFNAVEDSYGTDDCGGHGSHVTGTVLGTDYGVANGAQAVSVRVLKCNLFGSYSTIIKGIDWVTENAELPAVANFSINAPESATLDTATQRLVERGVVFVASAGNSTKDACTDSPARLPEVITVGATTNTDARNPSSSWGTCVTMWAPGRDIRSAANSSPTATRVATGTSMAAPHVAGAAALYLQAHPQATPAEVQQALVSQATPNALSDLRTGSPNLLLNVTQLLPTEPEPTDPEPTDPEPTDPEPTDPEPTPEPTEPEPTPEPTGEFSLFFGQEWTVRVARTVPAEVIEPGDQVLSGDWNGDGTDTLGLRRGNLFLLWDGEMTGEPDHRFWYGAPDDEIFVGDWDGDGADGIGVRREHHWHLRNTLTTGNSQQFAIVGNGRDEAFVGDFDSTGRDTVMFRAPGTNRFVVYPEWEYTATTRSFWYGTPDERVLVGDWNGDGVDGVAIVRDGSWHLRDTTTTGGANRIDGAGRLDEVSLVGDWDGNGTDTPVTIRQS